MTLAETIAANDLLRTKFKGGCIVYAPSVMRCGRWFRGRAVAWMSKSHRHMNHDHSEGAFVFGGYVFYWRIEDGPERRSLWLHLAEDILRHGTIMRKEDMYG